MKVTVTFDVSEETAKLLSECSVERVINTSVKIIDSIEGIQEETAVEEIDTNLSDWNDCKPVATQLWNAVRDGLFREKRDQEKQVRDWAI